MKIDEKRMGETTILKPSGPLIDSDADQLKGYLVGALGDTPGKIVLDAVAMPFADSRGLQVLVDTTRELARSGSKLKLAGATETLKEVMDLTNTTQLFDCFDDLESALEGAE